jgi:hypothetical protein
MAQISANGAAYPIGLAMQVVCVAMDTERAVVCGEIKGYGKPPMVSPVRSFRTLLQTSQP